MTQLKIRDIVNIDTISQDKVWKKIKDKLPDGDIEIDFTGVDVRDPWNCAEFNEIFSSGRVRMHFTNSESLVNRLKIMAKLSGIDDTFFNNTAIVKPPEKTADEKKEELYGKNLVAFFKVEDGKACFKASEKYSQIQNTQTIRYIKKAIEYINENQGISQFIIDLKGLTVLTNVTQYIVDMTLKFSENGIIVMIDSEDQDVINTYKLSRHNKTTKTAKDEEKALMFKEEIGEETPCMLIKYKSSKSTDDYGRHGKGEIISSRIAVLHKIINDNNKFYLSVTAYKEPTFYTKIHWAVEHDNDILKYMIKEDLIIPISQIGLSDKFLGTDFHMLLPIQQSLSENREVIYDIDDHGGNVKKFCTIPERIRYVFDSWDIKYNKEKLDYAIRETRKKLYGE